ncbi:MAG: 3-deoxy-manno-octulosonate cytidylyltransferase [Rickettsiales bacterium]
MQSAIIIPVRLASTRLPNKPLAIINGKTMIQRVYERAVQANIGEVFIACDGEKIADEVKKFGANFIITDPNLPSGTDRIYQASTQLNREFDVIINLQGDLPNIDPNAIKSCLQALKNSNCDMATIASEIKDEAEILNPNVVKIAVAKNGNALYFSRSPIPYSKDLKQQYLHHIGIYAYKITTLREFVKLTPSPLEIRESLEQLRALENGFKIAVEIVDTVPLSVDTQHDLDKIIAITKN